MPRRIAELDDGSGSPIERRIWTHLGAVPRSAGTRPRASQPTGSNRGNGHEEAGGLASLRIELREPARSYRQCWAGLPRVR